jgi:hypothetical protein
VNVKKNPKKIFLDTACLILITASSSFILNGEINALLNIVPFIIITTSIFFQTEFNKKILLATGVISVLMIYSFALDEINMYSKVRWKSLFQIIILFIVMSIMVTKDKVINGTWLHYFCSLILLLHYYSHYILQ